MSFFHSVQFLEDDADDADDFDLDFDEDYECLSDEEFEVIIDDDNDYDADDSDITGEFCLDDDLDGFGDLDALDEPFAEKDYMDEAP